MHNVQKAACSSSMLLTGSAWNALRAATATLAGWHCSQGRGLQPDELLVGLPTGALQALQALDATLGE